MSALSDSTRGRLLRLLEHTQLNVTELCAVLQIPQSTVSRHLKLLVDDGWVISRREGTSRYYQLGKLAAGSPRQQLWALLKDSLRTHPSVEHDAARLEQVLFERQTQSQEFFASSAGRWDRLRDELFGHDFQLRLLPALMPANSVVLDLGCGTGRLAEVIAPFAGRLIGVDASNAMIQAARRRLARHQHVQLHAGRLEALPLKSCSCDLVLIVLVMHYLPDPSAAFREASRVVVPGGKLVLVDMRPHDQEQYRAQMGHQWLGFTKDQVQSWASPNQLELAHFIELPPDSGAKGPPLFVATLTSVKDSHPKRSLSGRRQCPANTRKNTRHVTTEIQGS